MKCVPYMLSMFGDRAPVDCAYEFAPIPTAVPLESTNSNHNNHSYNNNSHPQHSASLAARAAASIRVQTIECVTATVIIALIVIASVWSFFHCFWCLVGIAVFSFCLCPFVHFYNFPLWIAIILLVVSLWAYLTVGEMRLGPFLLHWSRVQQAETQ